MDFGILWVTALGGLAVATFTDLQKREVADWLNYSLIAFGLGMSIILSAILRTHDFVLASVLGLLFGIIIGTLMYYTGQWGGGDSKLIMGLGALIGLSFPVSVHGLVYEMPFIFEFLLNLILVGALFGLAWTMTLGIRHRKVFLPEYKKALVYHKSLRYAALIIGFAGLLLKLITGNTALFAGCLLMFFMFYLWVAVRVVERHCMIKNLPVGRLVEGDWLFIPVKKKGRVIVSQSKTGLTLREISILKKENIREVVVREGVPFVPSFLIAFLVTSFLQGWWL